MSWERLPWAIITGLNTENFWKFFVKKPILAYNKLQGITLSRNGSVFKEVVRDGKSE